MRRELLLALVGIALLACGLAAIVPRQARTFQMQMDACHTPVTVMEPYQEPPIGNAIVLHGFASNRDLMLWVGEWLAAQGLRVYTFDLPGHGDSTEHFNYAAAESCAGQAIAAMADRGDINPDRTVLLGHSMGGEIAIRLADRFPAAATIALSPAPMVAPQRMPSNLLVVSAQFDLIWLRRQARKLQRLAGGPRSTPEDFAQRRAFALVDMPLTDHVSLLFDSRPAKDAAAWARQALGIPGPVENVPGAPRLGFLLGIAGLILFFPLAAALLAGRAQPNAPPAGPPALSPKVALANWAVAAVFAVALIAVVPYYEWLGLSNGSYLTSFLLIAGVALLPLVARRETLSFNWSVRGVSAAAVLAMLFALAFHAWDSGAYALSADSHRALLETIARSFLLTTPRWLRLAPAVLATFPYILAEEIALGPRQPGVNLRRFGVFVAMRFELWLVMVAAVLLTLNSEVLIALLFPAFIAVSVLQRYASDAIRRRTGSLAAAAIFGAILTGAFIVSAFPLT
jgi:pimeloyl-ACP methyl ester carboxylesterase